ncbi:hypothetical protein NMG60_11005763 [Bertholletia excelsa]
MGIDEGGGDRRVFPAAARPCDLCQMAASLLFCRQESAFICLACDEKLHGQVGLRHERVWLCEVCEQAPASVTCKADAAELCVTCDRDIHIANPLASRHERLPVTPFYDSAVGTARTLAGKCSDMKSIEFLFSESDPLLDFDYSFGFDSSGSDSIVPAQPKYLPSNQLMNQIESSNKCFEIDFANSKLSSYDVDVNINSYPALSSTATQSVSSFSMECGVVPDESSILDTSYPVRQSVSSAIETSGSGSTTTSHAKDREARVLRYREKRKNRKFEKKIRYASRKAYAETRPRIKGRFAKRIDSEEEAALDGLFGGSGDGYASFMADSRYGVVPTFRV